MPCGGKGEFLKHVYNEMPPFGGIVKASCVPPTQAVTMQSSRVHRGSKTANIPSKSKPKLTKRKLFPGSHSVDDSDDEEPAETEQERAQFDWEQNVPTNRAVEDQDSAYDAMIESMRAAQVEEDEGSSSWTTTHDDHDQGNPDGDDGCTEAFFGAELTPQEIDSLRQPEEPESSPPESPHQWSSNLGVWVTTYANDELWATNVRLYRSRYRDKTARLELLPDGSSWRVDRIEPLEKVMVCAKIHNLSRQRVRAGKILTLIFLLTIAPQFSVQKKLL